jgi:hypothetical protein
VPVAGYQGLQKGSQVCGIGMEIYKGLKIYSKIWYTQKWLPTGEMGNCGVIDPV